MPVNPGIVFNSNVCSGKGTLKNSIDNSTFEGPAHPKFSDNAIQI